MRQIGNAESYSSRMFAIRLYYILYLLGIIYLYKLRVIFVLVLVVLGWVH